MMSMMYQAYQNHMDLTAPWRTGAGAALKYLNLVPQGVSDKAFGRLASALELITRTSLTCFFVESADFFAESAFAAAVSGVERKAIV